MNIRKKTRSLTFLGVIIAIQLVMTFMHIGFIKLPFLSATILHIPVIIGAIFLGPVGGGILGLVFGILSVIMSTIEPGITSFVFSPFYSVDGNSGNMWSLVVAILPRIMIGITSYYTYYFISSFEKNKAFSYSILGIMVFVITYYSYQLGGMLNMGNVVSYIVAGIVFILIVFGIYKIKTKLSSNKWFPYAAAGVVGSATNTILVMSFIYIFFGDTGAYAEISQNGIGAIFTAIGAVVLTNGIPEAIAAALIVSSVGRALRKAFKSDFMLSGTKE